MDEQGSVVSGDKKIVSSLFQNVQTGCGPIPTSYSVGTAFVGDVKRQRSEADYLYLIPRLIMSGGLPPVWLCS